MTPESRTARTLAGLDPAFAAVVRQVLAAMAALHHPMVAYDGRRTTAQQQALYAQGRTAPGRKVTNADGVRRKSKHQDGHAVDAAFVRPLVEGRWDLTWSGPWEAYGRIGEELGLVWGGRWGESAPSKGDGWDRPHLEQP